MIFNPYFNSQQIELILKLGVLKGKQKRLKMKKSLLILSFLLAFYSFSQTKKIFHKSHSGKSNSLFLDGNNNFGPGMAPVRYRTPISPIKLNYAVTLSHEYPLVRLDTVKKTMRFFDLKDSLLGCDRNYKEYLEHGDIVFDVLTNEFYVFQKYFKSEGVKPWINTEQFLPISDSIDAWEKKGNYIRTRRHYIRDGNNNRILMTYPRLDNTITYSLQIIEPVIFQDAQKILINKNIEKADEELIKIEKVRVKKQEIKLQKTEEKQEEITVPISVNFPAQKSNYLLRWMTLILLVFSLFIFVGVQRIVKDELDKI